MSSLTIRAEANCSWPRQPFLGSSYRIEEAHSMRGLQVSTRSPEFNLPWMTMNWMSQMSYRGLELRRNGSLPSSSLNELKLLKLDDSHRGSVVYILYRTH